MLDIRLLRENPELVKDSQRKRKADHSIVDKVLLLDKKWRAVAKERDNLKQERNKVNMEILQLKKSGKSASSKIKEMKSFAEKIRKKDLEVAKAQKERDSIFITLPNILHDSVPPGKDETENKELRKVGKIPKLGFKAKDHIDICMDLDLFDIERAAKTSGARFYFLKNEAVQLEMALTHFALNELIRNGFTPVLTPHLVKERVMYGVGMLPLAKDEIYKVENEDLYMILTSEHAIGGIHMDEIMRRADLPKRYTSFSPCYRTEAGAHGRDTKGIFRVHQFNKVEMFIFSEPEKSWEEHELLLKNAENLVQKLELPYRIMNICTGDIGNIAAKKYDLDAWLPGQNAYREIISCANCTDYQARRLNIRCVKNPGDKPETIHTLNSTALALGRTLVAILENYQQKDGSVKVPKVLQEYTGFKEIKAKK